MGRMIMILKRQLIFLDFEFIKMKNSYNKKWMMTMKSLNSKYTGFLAVRNSRRYFFYVIIFFFQQIIFSYNFIILNL